MVNRFLDRFLAVVILLFLPLAAYAGVRLQRKGDSAQLFVNGKAMIVLAGELSNSAATSISDIDSVIPKVKDVGLNTVIIPAYWELIEPQEGVFDFSLIDESIEQARRNDLKVIFLWFGAWKNSMSCYAPLWFKQDVRRFPRAMTEDGKTMEIATAFSQEVCNADNRAFSSLMHHIAEVDRDESTVIMMQVENEIGMLESARDYCPLAEKAWQSNVPKSLTKALKLKKSGTWAEVFGTDLYAQEKFQAYHYGLYVEKLCRSAREILDIPLFVNAAMDSRGRRPGEYPSAGPLAHLMDIWHCAAPSLDFFSPDIYDSGFKGWVGKYATTDNIFFTPETQFCDDSGVRALYVFGATRGIGFSPFAVDQGSESSCRNLRWAYSILDSLSPILLGDKATFRSWGLLFDSQDLEQIVTDGDVVMTCRHYYTLPWDSRATDGSVWPDGGGLIIRIAADEYLIAGKGLVVSFQTKDERKAAKPAGDFSRLGLGSVDEVEIDEQGGLLPVRRLNGDQTHQGRHARISCDEFAILHVKLYKY